MYRFIDNVTGSILAIVFHKDLAEQFIKTFPSEELEPGYQRFCYEDCTQQPLQQIGNTLAQLGEHIHNLPVFPKSYVKI